MREKKGEGAVMKRRRKKINPRVGREEQDRLGKRGRGGLWREERGVWFRTLGRREARGISGKGGRGTFPGGTTPSSKGGLVLAMDRRCCARKARKKHAFTRRPGGSRIKRERKRGMAERGKGAPGLGRGGTRSGRDRQRKDNWP